MHETGVLTAIFPELEQIECLVIRDFFHRYTVDEHTLVTLQNLWSLRTTTDAWLPQLPRSAGRDQRARRPRLRAAVPRRRQGHARRRPRGRFAAPRAGAHDAHPDALAGSRNGDVPDRPPPGPVRRHVLARRLRSADHPRRGPPDGDRGAPQGAHAAHLRRHQRGESHRHDAVARRAALAALPQGLQRTHPRTGDRTHRSRPHRFARAHRLPGRLPHALPAHPLRSRDRRAHGARSEEPQARHGGGCAQAGFGMAAHADRARSSGPVRVAWPERSPASA